MSNKEITKKVTEGILKCLEKGVAVWKSPVISSIGMPEKFDGGFYQGMNTWILNAETILNDYDSNRWLTFNRCRKEGGKVLKGSKATEVIYWTMLDVKKTDANGQEVEKTVPLLRTFKVFNICQTNLFKPSKKGKAKKVTNPLLAESLIGNWTKKVNIRYGFDNTACPYYAPFKDYINIPFGDSVQWACDESLAKTTFHEMIHSTGHSSRLDRFKKAELDGVKADQLHLQGDYSAEELVAEMGAQILSDICGFSSKHLEESSSYINSWLKCLKSNTEWILWASSRAEKAVEMILLNANEKFNTDEKKGLH